MNLLKYDEMIEKKDELTAEYRNLKMIKIKDLADLVIDVLNECSNEDKLNNANEVADLLIFMLRQKKLLTETVQQTFIDLLIASTMLYNIKDITEDNWNEVYEIRKVILQYAKKCETIPEQAIDTICDTIEAQLGENMPIKGSRANPNTPAELFAMSVAIINKYNK